MKIYSACWKNFYPLDVFFPAATCKVAMKPSDLDEPGILMLHGGSDIGPNLYGKGLSRHTHETWPERDEIEWRLVQAAIKKNIFIFGICRGAQMLCAAAGGYLYQHVDNHAGRGHKVKLADGTTFPVNSLHHQMQAPWDVEHTMLAVAETPLSLVHYDVDQDVQVQEEPEAVFYPKIKGFGVQWHPEYLPSTTTSNVWVKKTLEDLYAQ